MPLYAPEATPPPKLDGVVLLAAGRWLEGGAAVVPVVFATDNQGNIYLTTCKNGKREPWKSFDDRFEDGLKGAVMSDKNRTARFFEGLLSVI